MSNKFTRFFRLTKQRMNFILNYFSGKVDWEEVKAIIDPTLKLSADY